jgi:hypothetical protein
MTRLIYGSSNVYRHYDRVKSSFGLDLELVRCTKKTVFDSHTSAISLLSSGSIIVTSVLANFIVDACRGLDATKVPLFADQQLTAHVETLASLLRGSVGAQVVIVPPLRRKVPGVI